MEGVVDYNVFSCYMRTTLKQNYFKKNGKGMVFHPSEGVNTSLGCISQ